MGIKLIRYKWMNEVKWGVLNNEDQIISLNTSYETTSDILQYEMEQIKANNLNDKEKVNLDTVEILSPITWPSKIVCQGANYGTHRAEVGMNNEKPPFNMFFSKDISSVVGAYSTVYKPKHVELLDYEIELGLVIGSQITKEKEVNNDNLKQFICGLVIFNDISARDVQFLEGQWLKGKSFRTFGPVGPYIYLLDEDEYELIDDLDLKLSVNDEIRQQTSTKKLLYKPSETIQELSEIMNLQIGDLIITGTTGGVALNMSLDTLQQIQNPAVSYETKREILLESQNNGYYLKDGDTVTCTIKSANNKINLGILRNKIDFD